MARRWRRLSRTSSAAFVVLPVTANDYTGATITLLSAMNAGKAVIASGTGAIAAGYGLESGRNVVIVPCGHEAALRGAMRTLASDAAKCARIGEQARAHVQAGFTVERFADDLAAIFWETLR